MIHPEKGQRPKPNHRWISPQAVCFKCNVDGAFSENDHTGATGVVIRDHDGQFKAGRAVWHNEAHDALLMEAKACRDGIEMAQQLGVSKLCLETDCLQLINLWNSLHTQRSAVSLILRDICSASRSFDEFTFNFANRSCNRVAHECARQVSCSNVLEEWHDNPPYCLQGLLADDCNHTFIL